MSEENKENVKLVDDFDGTPAIELTDSDAILEKKIMDIYNLELDVKLAIIRRIEDARQKGRDAGQKEIQELNRKLDNIRRR